MTNIDKIINYSIGLVLLILITVPLWRPLFRKRYTTNLFNINENNSSKDLTNCYMPQFLLSQNEKANFYKLLKWAKGKGYIVFAKVRLADLICPKSNNKKVFWKIQAKHVDFIICDDSIKVQLIIELQDNSHNAAKRIERDIFVKKVLENCGYKFIQLYSITEDALDQALIDNS